MISPNSLQPKTTWSSAPAFYVCAARNLAFMLLLAIAGWPQPVLAMSFTIEPATTVSNSLSPVHFAYGSGVIEPGSRKNLAVLIDSASPGVPIILILDSDGGLVDEALAMGTLIRNSNVATHIAADSRGCYSACFFLFIGGVHRSVEPGGMLGVHQFRSTLVSTPLQAEAGAQWMSSEILDFLERMGIDLYALFPILRTPHDQILTFSESEMAGLRITTPPCPFPLGFVVSDPFGLYPSCLSQR